MCRFLKTNSYPQLLLKKLHKSKSFGPTKVHSKSLDTYFRNRNNFYMVQYFYLFFSTGIESELFSIFSYKLYKNIAFKVAKNGTKNFQSFYLYKGKIIPQCSLELEHSKNIYFSYFQYI